MRLMKRIISTLAAAVVCSTSTFAGSFYGNAIVIGADPAALCAYLEEEGYAAYVAWDPASPGTALIAEEKSGGLDDRAMDSLCRKLSKAFKALVYASMVYDSDVYYAWLYKNGLKAFSLDSCPGYFEDGGGEPAFVGFGGLAKAFGRDEESLRALISPAAMEEYVFADELAARFLEELGLPAWANQLSFDYLDREKELRDDLLHKKLALRRTGTGGLPLDS